MLHFAGSLTVKNDAPRRLQLEDPGGARVGSRGPSCSGSQGGCDAANDDTTHELDRCGGRGVFREIDELQQLIIWMRLLEIGFRLCTIKNVGMPIHPLVAFTRSQDEQEAFHAHLHNCHLGMSTASKVFECAFGDSYYGMHIIYHSAPLESVLSIFFRVLAA